MKIPTQKGEHSCICTELSFKQKGVDYVCLSFYFSKEEYTKQENLEKRSHRVKHLFYKLDLLNNYQCVNFL